MCPDLAKSRHPWRTLVARFYHTHDTHRRIDGRNDVVDLSTVYYNLVKGLNEV